MTHVLFVTPYYPPEVGAPQTRISETATGLVKRGHRVTVLTTVPNYPTGVVPAEYHRGKRRRESRDGVKIIRVWSFVRPNRGFLNRILAQLSFGCLAPFLGGRAAGYPDIIIVESPPLFDVIAGRLLAWRKRCPWIFTVADIWPEAAIQMGQLRNRLAIWLAERLEWSAYRHASAVWTVTEGLRTILLKRGLPANHVFTISNGVDTTLFQPRARDEARAELGWGDGYVVLFAGTIGLAPGLMTLLDAAERLKDRRDIRIVLLGEGAAKGDLRAEAVRRGVNNLVFMDAVPHDRLPIAIAAADLCFAGLRRLPLFQGTMPVKCYEAMACARPILLAAADGLARQICIAEAGAGMAVEPEDAGAIATGICFLHDHPDVAQACGARGRAFVEARFSRAALTEALDARIAALLAG